MFAYLCVMQQVKALENFLSQPRNILLIPHRKPDGDALGSVLALYHYFREKGHQATALSPTNYASFMEWLPGNDNIIIYNQEQPRPDHLFEEAELLFCMDFNRWARTGEMEAVLSKSPAKKAIIDHHPDPPDAFDFGVSNPDASSTAELVYDLICSFGDKNKINKDIAECIYTGILTDTGSFRFNKTTAKVHRIVADLIEQGVKAHVVHEKLFDANTENRLRFFGHCMKEKLTVLPELQTAFIAVSAKELEQYQIKTGDTEGLVNYPLSLKNVKFAALIIDRTPHNQPDKKVVKMSFRSKGHFPANEFAQKYFEGGGHENAAGGISYTTLRETVDKFLNKLPEYKMALQT